MKKSHYKSAFEVILAADFEHKLLNNIERATKRIYISTMTLEYTAVTAPIFQALRDAVKRGVSVHLLFDIYTNSLFRERALIKRGIVRRTQRELQILKAEGAAIHFVGSMQIDPFVGRYHQKIYIVDDLIFSYGGINFNAGTSIDRDIMIFHQDGKTADYLTELLEGVARREVTRNQSFVIDESSTILFDGGEEQSVIYDTALKLAKDSKRVYFVSRMCPSGELAAVLQGTHTTYFYNRPFRAALPTTVSIVIDQLKYKLKNSYTNTPYLHAKCMLFELVSGEKVLLTGSHNFNERGVTNRTKEIALVTRDAQLYDSFFNFINHLNDTAAFDSSSREE